MADLQHWEQQLQHELAELRRNGQRAARAIEAVRGRCEAHGVTIEVNVKGDITSLHIAPGAMRWSSTQLTNTLMECHQKAQADAAAKAKRVAHPVDPRIKAQLQQLRNVTEAEPTERRPAMTEAEIQAADDAYFERMNRQGWPT
ncbi:YbaB/EbfC family nucleoid-associated protein [Nocardia exalbida]|uniref:YbaB/EbfC family nucleoid-associated protein n=1 Tax=Nocardia exalbida TaxID=290231 RepID=UPI0009FF7369|nr:YbaB/EbfC family nucleoid-associated protein [Nocardia exalbida]